MTPGQKKVFDALFRLRVVMTQGHANVKLLLSV